VSAQDGDVVAGVRPIAANGGVVGVAGLALVAGDELRVEVFGTRVSELVEHPWRLHPRSVP